MPLSLKVAYTTAYYSAIITVVVSYSIFELFDVEKYNYLEI